MESYNVPNPPNDLEAEFSILGACLIDKDVIPKVRGLLKPEDFYSDKHQWAFEAICRVSDRKEPVDLITVQAELKAMQRFEAGEAFDFLTDKVNRTPTTANTEAHARIVQDKAVLRRLQTEARKIVEGCYVAENADAMKAEAMQRIHSIIFQQASNRERQLGPALLDYAESVINTASAGGKPKGLLETSFKIQDQIMPMCRGEVTVAVAASGIGKTTYEKNLQFGVAKLGGRVKGYSLEMSERQLLQKYWGMIAEIDTMAIRRATLTPEEIQRTLHRAIELLHLPLYFEAHPRMRWADIKLDALAFASRHGKVDLITVDYLQILGDPVPKNGRRDSQLGEMVEEAKLLSVDLDCHVCFLAQQKISKLKPIGENEDVTESRDIVRASDNVLFLTRPTEFDPEAKINLPYRKPSASLDHKWDWYNEDFLCGQAHPKRQGYLLFHNVMLGFQGKQRMGAKSVIPYEFIPETGVVRDLPKPWPWDDPGEHPRDSRRRQMDVQ